MQTEVNLEIRETEVKCVDNKSDFLVQLSNRPPYPVTSFQVVAFQNI